jgi:choline monooxygenase
MQANDFFVDPDITKAYTLPAAVYNDKKLWTYIRENIFMQSWQFAGGDEIWPADTNCAPYSFLPGLVNEPMLFVRKGLNEELCMSNVCTHRGKLLIEQAGKYSMISCGYHGRCFRLDGRFKSMPEFESVQNFPAESDHLRYFPVDRLGEFRFVSLNPIISENSFIQKIVSAIPSYDFDQLQYEASLSADYKVKAHWLAYCDNYLEGFHIPFVHKTLNEKISYEDYRVQCFDQCSVQIADARPGEESIRLTQTDPDYGKDIYAYYWFCYPNTMINIYSWGVSINVVLPVTRNKTRILFRTYLLPGTNPEKFRNTALHQTEMEDEAIVESVQKGLQSKVYHKGRFSPSREQAVHAFHKYLSDVLSRF